MSGERINILIALMALVFVGAVKGQSRAQQPSAQAGGESLETDGRQIEVLLGTKAQRTPAQRKVSSQLLDAQRAAVAARRQVQGASVADELVTVDIRADITPAVLARIRALGGTVINSLSRYRAIRARLPLASVEKLAALDAIQSISAADEAATPGPPPEFPSEARAGTPDVAEARAVTTSEGDVAHSANLARTTHGVDGTGIGIGVLSNGIATLCLRNRRVVPLFCLGNMRELENDNDS